METKYEDQLLLLRSGDPKALESIYKNNEAKFTHWILRHYPYLSLDDAKDIFQNAVIILYENIKTGKLTDLQSSISTYLFGIGNNLVRAFAKKLGKEPIPFSEMAHLEIVDELQAYIVNREKIMGLLEKIGDKCQKLLVSSVSSKFKSEDFAKVLGYPSAEMYRKKKHECLRKLKGIIEERKLTIDHFLE